MRPTDGSRLALDSHSVSVRSRRVTVPAGTTLGQLLRAQGVQPDAEALSAVYQLNPTLTGPALTAGAEVTIIRVNGPDTLRWALANGYLAYVTADVTLKRRVAARAQALAGFARALADLSAEQLGGEEMKNTVVAAVNRIRDFANAVGLALEARTRPIDTEVLMQIDAELGAVDSTLSTLIAGKSPLSANDRELLVTASEDARVRSVYWTESMGPEPEAQRYPRVQIVVRALEAGHEVPGLRVYFTPRAMFGRSEPEAFPHLTSPSARALPFANYVIWVEDPADRSRRSDPFRFEALYPLSDKPDTVDLVVRR